MEEKNIFEILYNIELVHSIIIEVFVTMVIIAIKTAITKVIRTASAETISAGTTQNNKIKYINSSGNALSSAEINKIHTF